MRYNRFKQPIGEAMDHFTEGQSPQIEQLIGQYAVVKKLDTEILKNPQYLEDLWQLYGSESPLQYWTYLPIEPFSNKQTLYSYLTDMVQSQDPYYLAVFDKQTDKLLGTFALMRVDRQNRVIEMGWVLYSEQLQRSRIATEAQFLVMRYVFETLQYRRYEWKCDSLNQPSYRCAERLGFRHEGTFRQLVVYKQRSRDTAWFSLLDCEWQANKQRLEKWLDPNNFDENGQQILALGKC